MHLQSSVQRFRAALLPITPLTLALLALAAVVTLAATPSAAVPSAAAQNPAADGFDAAGSDARAIQIADAVMEAMGGREAYDGTRYLSWRFFGRRLHVWDKWTGRARVEFESEDGVRNVILMNLRDRQGRAWRDELEMTAEVDRNEMLTMGYEAWINDSYWLLMPYKLKDSGVTLKYLGEGETSAGAPAEILQLTFAGVGVTPQNKYDVYVGRESKLVEEWAFYREASDPEPRFRTPWAHWSTHGRILLSADRGEYQHTELAVFDELPDAVFEDPGPLQLPR